MEIKLDQNIVSNLASGQISAEQVQKKTQKSQITPAAQLSEDFGKFQEQALQISDDTANVEKARQALLNGELDSQEAILSAAENLLTFGL
jgi:hypothetical protein